MNVQNGQHVGKTKTRKTPLGTPARVPISVVYFPFNPVGIDIQGAIREENERNLRRRKKYLKDKKIKNEMN